MSPSPVVDEEKIAKLIKALKKPVEVGDLVDRLGVSKKTVYRYLDLLEERGFIIEHSGRTRPVTYQIKNRLPAPSDS